MRAALFRDDIARKTVETVVLARLSNAASSLQTQTHAHPPTLFARPVTRTTRAKYSALTSCANALVPQGTETRMG